MTPPPNAEPPKQGFGILLAIVFGVLVLLACVAVILKLS